VDFYVVAFIDRPLPRRRISGRHYASAALGGVAAVGECRGDQPAATDDELRHQHEVVVRVAERVDAILPVRFGALTSRAALEQMAPELVRRLTDGLSDVRHKVQMTVRFVGEPAPAARPVRPTSGVEYLRNRQAAMVPELPPEAVAWLGAVRSVVARERIAPGAGSVLATAYHLVRTEDLPRYFDLVSHAGASGARVTGPFPPFAFTPAIL
jgi:hypothetical protein